MGIESPVHLLFIAIIALIVLGPKRLPELARSLGHGIREFRGSLEAAVQAPQPPPPAEPPAQPLQPLPPPAAAAAPPPQTAAAAPSPPQIATPPAPPPQTATA